MNPRTPLALAGAALVLLGASGCSTTYDSTIANTTTTVAVTTTLPTGTLQEILPRMLEEVAGLSAKVASGQGDQPSADLIEQYWKAIEPEVQGMNQDLVEDFEFIVRRCHAAADRNRPADADRAYRNLRTIADSLLGPGDITDITADITTTTA